MKILYMCLHVKYWNLIVIIVVINVQEMLLNDLNVNVEDDDKWRGYQKVQPQRERTTNLPSPRTHPIYK